MENNEETMISKQLTDDQSSTDDSADGTPGSEYAFEGFRIDFSEKVMLTMPAADVPLKGGAGQ
jgi:hypothetical protein